MLFQGGDKNIKGTAENQKKLHKELYDLQRASSKISKDEAAFVESELRKKMNAPSGLSKEEFRQLAEKLKYDTHDPKKNKKLKIIKKKLDL